MATIIASTYELIDIIGSGGGGVVYLAKHLRLDKNVVLKADRRKITTRPEILRREVDALKNLNHTYIPQVYDYFVENETVYTVIDYIDGESLNKPLKRGEKFTQPQVIKWACQLLEALSYLHNPVHGNPPKGIVHSDIKPANIMLTKQGNICLIDFNIALALGEENIVGLTAGYASPEHYGISFSTDTSFTNSKDTEPKESTYTKSMIDADKTKTMGMETATMAISSDKQSTSFKKTVIPDARSDIYSLGATLYHLLSGKRPAKNADEVMPLSDNEFSPQIVRIISKAMMPNPDLRYQTADEMLYDFRHLRENDNRTKKRKKLFVSVTAILAALFLVGVITSFTGLKGMETLQKSLTYAEYAQTALENGNPDLAIDNALIALEDGKGLFLGDYTAAAKKALSDSLGIYDLSDGYKLHHNIELPAEPFKITLSPDGNIGVATYSFEMAVFNTETGEILNKLPIVNSALSDAVFVDNNTIVYAGDKGLTAYNIKDNKIIWTGKPTTHIAVAADGQTIAAIYRDESFAMIYDINGNEKSQILFNNKKQKVLENDTFADTRDNLLTLDRSGKYMAVSFADGGLTIFNTQNINDSIEIYDKSDFTHFEGGFNDKYFAFSSTKDGLSNFSIVDTNALVETIGFELDSKIGVHADENGIVISNKSTIVSINPESGEQNEMAYTDSDIRVFSTDGNNTIVATEKNDYLIYDSDADLISQYNAGQFNCNFVDISSNFAIEGGMDTPNIRILKQKEFENNTFFNYDKEYYHDEARINSAGTRLMLFDYMGFRLYDMNYNIIKEVSMPNSDKIYDQQYVKDSGNLAVMYNDAFRLYSGSTGEILYEETDLKTVLYTTYGVSILDRNNKLKLIDLNTGEIITTENAAGDYAVYCGMVVDNSFLNGKKVIGAAKKQSEYFFAAAENDVCYVYNNQGKELFNIPMVDESETFFTENEIIISPLHGTPSVYSFKTGEKITDLEKDAYLTYIFSIGEYIVSDYISASGERYGILLDKNTYEPLAYLPWITDEHNGEIVFDYHKGKLRKSRIYPIDELINLAKEGSR